MPPSQQLQDNCTAQGKALGKVAKDGCVVGYECTDIENETDSGEHANVRAQNACAAPEGLYRNMLEYTNMLSNAEKANDSAAYARISEKIANTQEAMAEAMKQCGNGTSANDSSGMMQQTAHSTANRSDIYAYYMGKVDNVTASSSDAETKVKELIAIKSDIEARIAQIINDNQKFDSAEISQVVDEINVTPTAIAAGSVNVEATGKSIALDASSGRLDISQGNGFVSLRQGDTEATAGSITISNNTITIGNGQVRVLPVQARAIMGGTMRSLQLKDDSGMPVYVANVSTNARIFGFIPATYDKTKVISAETGVTISEDKPWWSVLAIDQPAQNST